MKPKVMESFLMDDITLMAEFIPHLLIIQAFINKNR